MKIIDIILMSYETKNDQWMIPGGGLEKNESDYVYCSELLRAI